MNDDNRIFTTPADAGRRACRVALASALRRRRVLLVVVVLVALALLAWLLTPKGTRAPAGRFGANGPMPVVGAPAKSGDMPIVLNGLGAVTPIATVTVQSQISGQITQIPFKEGQIVKPGDPLIQIDPRPYQVALEQAEGALVRDKALLANARVDLARYETLFKAGFGRRADARHPKVARRAGRGQRQDRSGPDRCVEAQPRLLPHCLAHQRPRGLQQMNLGNYVTPAEPNGLVVVTQLQPITVVFTLPEDQIPALQAAAARRQDAAGHGL
jgi:multidrug efflux system membrane fusion protein